MQSLQLYPQSKYVIFDQDSIQVPSMGESRIEAQRQVAESNFLSHPCHYQLGVVVDLVLVAKYLTHNGNSQKLGLVSHTTTSVVGYMAKAIK